MTLRLLFAGAVGTAAGLLTLLVSMDPVARVLAGVSVAFLAYSLPLIALFVRLDEAETEQHFARVDPSRSETELLAGYTTYTLRYAKHYLAAEPGCISFEGSDGGPRLSDFAYLSFTLGMTYQVSDTDLQSPAVRRIVWAHTMLSYLFGTVVIASTINLMVSLAG